MKSDPPLASRLSEAEVPSPFLESLYSSPRAWGLLQGRRGLSSDSAETHIDLAGPSLVACSISPFWPLRACESEIVITMHQSMSLPPPGYK